MKLKSILGTAALLATVFVTNVQAQNTGKSTKARAEYIEVEPNVRLHITDLGEGKTVVLIHGYPLSDASWEYQYHPLIKAGYRVIGITLRGFGQSDKPYGKYDYDQFASDIKTVLDKLDIKDATLAGHSMGGAIALHYVAKYNSAHVSKLALFSAAAPLHTKRSDYPYPLFKKEDITQWIELNNNDRPALLNAVGEKFVLSATSVSPGIGAWLGSIEMQSSAYAMEQALIALRDEDLRGDLPKIKIPTLILHAKQDKIVSYELAEQMHKAIAGSQLIPFEKSGHASFIEEKDKFNAEFIKFLKQ
ncbi:pimeloyl-ACP methyl ester carboxylesterase [Chryseobacterium ginsenosidimutans]|uniref:alpha/beta fold hydrolase n=1 Tax=Chryseobacterium ginsenosidimutans TaxID=687846 RepID=UPI002168C3DF|nr:alpha/beta hydrolase [Chryseobacterium ginsenosidimutans]MCS3870333.1 pimeloyl-ACP methyl ester carboxylesterase [Chryseobacterium ginsenosidimutans]